METSTGEFGLEVSDWVIVINTIVFSERRNMLGSGIHTPTYTHTHVYFVVVFVVIGHASYSIPQTIQFRVAVSLMYVSEVSTCSLWLL